jgi:hypothetical protein
VTDDSESDFELEMATLGYVAPDDRGHTLDYHITSHAVR